MLSCTRGGGESRFAPVWVLRARTPLGAPPSRPAPAGRGPKALPSGGGGHRALRMKWGWGWGASSEGEPQSLLYPSPPSPQPLPNPVGPLRTCAGGGGSLSAPHRAQHRAQHRAAQRSAARGGHGPARPGPLRSVRSRGGGGAPGRAERNGDVRARGRRPRGWGGRGGRPRLVLLRPPSPSTAPSFLRGGPVGKRRLPVRLRDGAHTEWLHTRCTRVARALHTPRTAAPPALWIRCAPRAPHAEFPSCVGAAPARTLRVLSTERSPPPRHTQP